MDLNLVRTMSTIMNRAMLAMRGGTTFDGKRNVYEALGYKNSITPEDFIQRYARGGIAARVAEAYPKATWRGGVELIEDDDPEVLTDFESEFNDLAKRVSLVAALRRTDILAGLGRFSVMLIGAPGALSEPLKKLRVKDIAYLASYPERDVSVATWITASDNPRFGLPETYRISRMAGESTAGGFASQTVHWTRVLHVTHDAVDDRVYGHPVMERVWNDLDNLDKVVGGGAEAFWKRADQGLFLNLDKDTVWADGEGQKIEEAADELVHGMRRVMATRGMEAKQLGSDVANFGPPVDSILTIIAGATGIPKRILMGSERGELSSTQDKENWEQRVADRRMDHADHQMLTPLVQRLIEYGALPEPEKFDVRWQEIEALNDKDKATVATAWADLNKKSGGVVVLDKEIRELVLGLDALTPAEIEEATPAPPPSPVIAPTVPGEAVPPAAKAASARHQEIHSKTRGSAAYWIRRSIREARRAHDPARVSVREAHHAMLALALPMSELKRWMGRASNVLANAHHEMRGKTRVKKTRAASLLRVADRAVDDASVQYSATRAGKMVTDITEQTRQNVADLVQKSLERDWSEKKLARELRSVIGVDERGAKALDNLRTRLEDAQPGDVVEYGGRSVRVPGTQSDEFIDRHVDRYSEDLVKARAEMIAETEVGEALADGQRSVWGEMQADGELSDGAERVWRAGSDACDECVEMDGETAPVGEPYSDGSMGPLMHPNCGCYEDLFEPSGGL